MEKALVSEGSPRRHQRLLCEDFDVILYDNRTNQVEAYVIIPRGAELLKEKVFRSSQPAKPGRTRPLAELDRTLANLEATYPKLSNR